MEKLRGYGMAVILATFMTINAQDTQAPFDEKEESAQKSSYVQKYEHLEENLTTLPLSLKGAIEQSFRKNFGERDRVYQKELLELNYDDAKDKFWFPEVNLTLSTEPQKIGRLRKGNKDGSASKYANGAFALDLGEFTLFNWGKDYLSYLNAKNSFLRGVDQLSEAQRALRHQIILKYFELEQWQSIVKSHKEQLRHASFTYRYTREKVSLKKVSKQDYYQARSEFLKAQSEYHLAKNNFQVVQDSMATLIGDEGGIRYILRDQLTFKKLEMKRDTALEMARKRNPQILDAKVNLKNAQREYEIQVRENMPLPKVTMDLGAYTQSFGSNNNRFNYQTQNGGSNLDIVATINASWTLYGPGGFFNRRRTREKTIEKYRQFNQLTKAKLESKNSTLTGIHKIKYLENQISILEARNGTLQRNFDTVLENYLNRKTTFVDYHHALNEMINNEILLSKNKYWHLYEKISLAQTLGLDDFPSDNFENLGQLNGRAQ